MRRALLASGFVVALTAAAGGADIVPGDILDHVKFLASDDLKGRGNGTEGLERAAEYIAGEFKEAGLQPGGANGTWFQPFELIAGLTVGRDNRLTIASRTHRVTLSIAESYYPLAAPANEDPSTPSTKFEGVPVVFAGYGLVVPALGYDDYASVDVKDRVALIFSHEPQEQNPNSRLNGTRPMPQTTLAAKTAAARTRGARALVVIGDPSHSTDDANYGLFGHDPDADRLAIPVLRVRRSDMQPLIDEWGLDRIARQMDQDLMPRSRALEGASADYLEHLALNRRIVRNVVGTVPGSDPAKADEAVVVGAHYDHVGVGGRYSVTPERTGEIHNGADDNASGTAAVIEMGRAAAANRSRFPRTLVFVAFAGEERGLLGSEHYTSSPVIPMERTVAMLNLDMVGRARGGVDVSGLESAPSIEADLKAAAQSAGGGLEIRRQGPGAGRSDDSSFLARRVPAINFFTGFHNDYHRPGDDWDKVDVAGTTRIATLALELAARIAARPDRPTFVQR